MDKGAVYITLLLIVLLISSCQKEDVTLEEIPKGDTLPPTVSFISLGEGDTVWNTVNITLDVKDNDIIAFVQLKDGYTLIGEDSQPPYQIKWDSKKERDGPFMLTAEVVDVSGNRTEKKIKVNIFNELIYIKAEHFFDNFGTGEGVVVISNSQGQVLISKNFKGGDYFSLSSVDGLDEKDFTLSFIGKYKDRNEYWIWSYLKIKRGTAWTYTLFRRPYGWDATDPVDATFINIPSHDSCMLITNAGYEYLPTLPESKTVEVYFSSFIMVKLNTNNGALYNATFNRDLACEVDLAETIPADWKNINLPVGANAGIAGLWGVIDDSEYFLGDTIASEKSLSLSMPLETFSKYRVDYNIGYPDDAITGGTFYGSFPKALTAFNPSMSIKEYAWNSFRSDIKGSFDLYTVEFNNFDKNTAVPVKILVRGPAEANHFKLPDFSPFLSSDFDANDLKFQVGLIQEYENITDYYHYLKVSTEEILDYDFGNMEWAYYDLGYLNNGKLNHESRLERKLNHIKADVQSLQFK